MGRNDIAPNNRMHRSGNERIENGKSTLRPVMRNDDRTATIPVTNPQHPARRSGPSPSTAPLSRDLIPFFGIARIHPIPTRAWPGHSGKLYLTLAAPKPVAEHEALHRLKTLL